MVETYTDLFEAMISLKLVDRWLLMYKTIHLTPDQYGEQLSKFYRTNYDRLDAPLFPKEGEQMIYKSNSFQINIEVRNVNKSD